MTELKLWEDSISLKGLDFNKKNNSNDIKIIMIKTKNQHFGGGSGNGKV